MGACGSGRDGRGRPRSSFPAERAGSARLSPESLQERPIPSSRRDTGVEGRGLGGACRDVEGRGLMGPPPVTTENAVVPPVRLVLGEMGLERSAWRFRRVPLALDDGWGGRDLEERAQVRRRFQKGAEKEKPSLERPQWQGAKEVGSRGERREGLTEYHYGLETKILLSKKRAGSRATGDDDNCTLLSARQHVQ